MYKTIENIEVVTEFIEKKSRFISYASHVTSVEEAMAFLEKIKEKHWDATHNVYAYILKDNQIKKYSDDGEPHGTAGIHILNVLSKSQIYDVIVVVTRYFGGTLLGTGGLVKAYTNSCKLVLKEAKIIFVYLCEKILIIFDYSVYPQVQRIMLKYQHKILETIYDNVVSIEMLVNSSYYNNLKNDLLEATSGTIKIKEICKLETNL